MRYIPVLLTTLALFMVGPAAAQSPGGVGQAIDDLVSGVLGKDARAVRGRVVLATPTGLIVRADDGRTYTVDTSALPAASWQNLQPGQAVTIAAKPGPSADRLIAARIQPDPSKPAAAYQTARGTVQSVTGSEAMVRTADGRTLALDISSLPSTARPTPGQSATVVYDAQAQSGRPTALWMQPEAPGTQPSASVPSGASDAGYQRLRGYVESVGVSSLVLKADSGQTVAVDTSALNPQMAASPRPGDLVTVVGQMTGTSFRASTLQKE
jgi:hypothetical protein